MTGYATYDADGIIVKCVDIIGSSHKNANGISIPTPHVLEYDRTIDPRGAVRPNTPRKSVPRPDYPDETQFYK